MACHDGLKFRYSDAWGFLDLSQLTCRVVFVLQAPGIASKTVQLLWTIRFWLNDFEIGSGFISRDALLSKGGLAIGASGACRTQHWPAGAEWAKLRDNQIKTACPDCCINVAAALAGPIR